MNGIPSCWTLAGLSVGVVFATGCAERPLPARDASTADALGGVAEEQTTDPKGTQAADERDSGRFRRTLGWIGFAVGIEGGAVAVTTSFMLLHEKSRLDDNCDAQKACSSAGVNAKSIIAETVPWNTTSWIVAAAGLGAGTILLLTSLSDSGRTTSVTVSPAPSGASFGLRSSF
jgi:hypothetical protein